MKIDTILVPNGAEHRAVRLGLQQAKVDDVQLLGICIGLGSLEKFLRDNQTVIANSSCVLILGLAGSLSSDYPVGNGVIIESCWNLQHHQIRLDAQLACHLKQNLALDLASSLTSDRPICSKDDKALVASEFDALVVEMEGFGYGCRLLEQGKAVGMIRVISDDLSGDIPTLTPAIDSQGNLRPLIVALILIRQPWAAMRLIRGSLLGLAKLEELTYQLFAS